jgi:hypothetical protein
MNFSSGYLKRCCNNWSSEFFLMKETFLELVTDKVCYSQHTVPRVRLAESSISCGSSALFFLLTARPTLTNAFC